MTDEQRALLDGYLDSLALDEVPMFETVARFEGVEVINDLLNAANEYFREWQSPRTA